MYLARTSHAHLPKMIDSSCEYRDKHLIPCTLLQSRRAFADAAGNGSFVASVKYCKLLGNPADTLAVYVNSLPRNTQGTYLVGVRFCEVHIQTLHRKMAQL